MRLLIDIDEKNKQGNDGSDGSDGAGGDVEGRAKRHRPMSAAECRIHYFSLGISREKCPLPRGVVEGRKRGNGLAL